MVQLSDTIKRTFDLAIAAAGLILAMPLMLVIALCIRCRMGVPILFRQPRPGLNGKPFTILKFRTMTTGPEPDAERITRLHGRPRLEPRPVQGSQGRQPRRMLTAGQQHPRVPPPSIVSHVVPPAA